MSVFADVETRLKEALPHLNLEVTAGIEQCDLDQETLFLFFDIAKRISNRRQASPRMYFHLPNSKTLKEAFEEFYCVAVKKLSDRHIIKRC